MRDALEYNKGSVSIGGRIINFRFSNSIFVNAEEEEEIDYIVTNMDTTGTRYAMKIGPDMTTVMTNNPNCFQREIKIKCQRKEEVRSFKYLGSVI